MERSCAIGLLLVALAGCGGGGGDDDCTGPAVSSVPPTAATAESQYIYSVEAAESCIILFRPATCYADVTPLQLPSGARVVNDRHIIWTPTADQANTNQRFVIATGRTCRKPTQSWTVHVDGSAITSFTAARSLLNPGESTTVTAVFSGTGRLGNNSIASGVPVTVGPLDRPWQNILVVSTGSAEFQRSLTIDVTPGVVHTSPSGGETDVAINRALTAGFNKPLDAATVDSSTFLLADTGGNAVAGTVAYSNGAATFTPAGPLRAGTQYVARVTTGVRDPSGHAMATDHVWTFSTGIPDTTPPAVTATSPAHGTNGIAIEDFRLLVTFSEALDPNTVDGTSFVLRDANGNALSGSLGLIDGGTTLQFMGPLQPLSAHTATLTTRIRDLAGNALPAGYSFSFVTKDRAWRATSRVDAPSPRYAHSAVWTGSRMLVWGGYDGTRLGTGGSYDPVTDSWTPIAMTGAPSARSGHTVVWTGTEMIVWGGNGDSSSFWLNTGARYNPATSTWSPVSTSGAPSVRAGHTAVWTGTEMIVWGGQGNPGTGTVRFNSGARYDPATDSWTPITAAGAPGARVFHTAVWTGTEMIVWGGTDGTRFATGGRYNPVANTWSATSTAGAPSARDSQAAIWTGSEMIIWGGTANLPRTGARYDPALDTWRPVSPANEPIQSDGFSSAWNGSEMMIWGAGGGATYSPATDAWTPITTSGAFMPTYRHSAIWSGTEMITWGGTGQFSSGYLDTGARYRQ